MSEPWEQEAGGEQTGAERLLGQVLSNRYRLLALLGQGGSSLVFAAEHVATQRPCAIKLLHPELVAKAGALRRFRLEAERAGAIVHDHVVAILDYDVARGSPYLVMELLRGETLRSLLDRAGRLPLGEALPIAQQLCAGVGAAHARGLVHRDLKPENVFITRRSDGTLCAKVLDFGVAKSLHGEETAQTTKPGTLLGTVRYMAPEQLKSPSEVDGRADVYAIGLILYEMLSGKPAFSALELHAVMQQVLFEAPAPLGELAPALPRALIDCVERACQRDVSARFASTEQLARALQAAEDARFVLASDGITREEEVELPAAPRSAATARTAAFVPFQRMREPDRPTVHEVVRRSFGIVYLSWRLILATAVAGLLLAGVLRAF